MYMIIHQHRIVFHTVSGHNIHPHCLLKTLSEIYTLVVEVGKEIALGPTMISHNIYLDASRSVTEY